MPFPIVGAVDGPVEPPPGLQPDALAVWTTLAPDARTAGTLTKGTAVAFALVCRAVVLELNLANNPFLAGGPNHRGLMLRVEIGLAKFGLAPFGKSLIPAAIPVDAFAEFEARR